MLIGFCAAYSRTLKRKLYLLFQRCPLWNQCCLKIYCLRKDMKFLLPSRLARSSDLDVSMRPPLRLTGWTHTSATHRLLVRDITMIKMTQEDYFKLEIRESQSLAKQRLRGRSRKKGKKPIGTEKISLKKKAEKTNKQSWNYNSVLSELSVCWCCWLAIMLWCWVLFSVFSIFVLRHMMNALVHNTEKLSTS